MNEATLGELIEKAAKTNQRPEIRRVSGSFSPGFLKVYLCNIEVESFDTYYYTASRKANDFVAQLGSRIKNCSSALISEQSEKIKALELELESAKCTEGATQ